jgi:flagellar biosynthetic protein FliQ
VNHGHVITLIQDSLRTILMIALPLLGIGLVLGLLISIFQAATQISEQTVVFVTKIISVFMALLIFGSWILIQLTEYFHRMVGYIMYILR